MAEQNLNENLYAQMQQSKEMDRAKTFDEKHIAAERLALGELPKSPPYQPIQEDQPTMKNSQIDKSPWWKFWKRGAPSKSPQPVPTPDATSTTTTQPSNPQLPKAA